MSTIGTGIHLWLWHPGKSQSEFTGIILLN